MKKIGIEGKLDRIEDDMHSEKDKWNVGEPPSEARRASVCRVSGYVQLVIIPN